MDDLTVAASYISTKRQEILTNNRKHLSHHAVD